MSFVHLHVHSEYSLLDGLSRIPMLVERAKAMGMPAIALTDHGVMCGVIDFYAAASEAGIKPIIGMEAYLAPRSMYDRDAGQDGRTCHLLLLAENEVGYHNLLKIATTSQLEGFYYRPRIDFEYLAQHSDGLFCSSGCLSGEVPRAIIEGRGMPEAIRLLDRYFEIFDRDHFLFELQQHDIRELPEVNRTLIDLSKRYQGRLVATNDVHYIEPGDAELQDILLCIQTGAVRSDPDRMRMTDPSYYLRSPQEMQSLFAEVPQALDNTLWVAEHCHLDLSFTGYHLPLFPVPEGHTPQSYLRQLCEAGLRKHFGPRGDEPELRRRLDYELGIIHQMGFEAYFLIVWDLCRFAKEQGIWYNARGSAAASIVAYALEITLVDPLEHGLIFERFLNPDRVSMPDIDLDFQDDRRSSVLEYAAQKYGQDRVAQIITFGTLGARAAIRDVARVLDIPLPEVDRVAKLIPNIPGKPMSIPEALEQVQAFKEAYESAPYLGELVDIAAKLEGVARNAGTHAAGVIIADRPIIDYIPLHRPTSGSQEDSPIKAVTQFEMQVLESLGLLKVDFLGLSTLTVMERACKWICQRHGVEMDLHSIPVEDPPTYELLGRGEVMGVFQVEGAGMRRYLMEMKPRQLANVIAMVALYRPGPLEFIPTYIRRMHGKEAVTYQHIALEPIFKETFGIPVYQEQIMFAAMSLAGYSAADADALRKAIAKKKAKELDEQRDEFVKGATQRGIPLQTARAIFQEWENFARYGFNKAHAADYGVIAVKTAYLKAHYPLEYMTALLSVFKHDSDRVALYIHDCRRMGIGVLPPDIDSSGLDFQIVDLPEGGAAIRFGLGAVKNVGDGAVQVMLQEREHGGPFETLEAFARRVDLRQVGKRALESLVRVGAFDRFGPRLAVQGVLDRLIALSTSHFRAEEIGQLTLFGAATGIIERLDLPTVSGETSRRQILSWEKELLGVYASDHPLSPHAEALMEVATHFSSELEDVSDGQEVVLAGMVSELRPYRTREGKAMGFMSLEDLQGKTEIVVFNRLWDRVVSWLEPDKVVVVRGKVDRKRGDPKVLADEIRSELVPTEKRARHPRREVLAEEPPDAVFAAGSGEETAAASEGLSPDAGSVGEQDWLLGNEPFDKLTQAPPADSSQVDAEPPPEAGGLSNDELTAGGLQAGDGFQGMYVLTIALQSTGDRFRDARRVKRVHGLLSSYPGRDRFAFVVHESSRHYRLEFPGSTTGYCPELHAQLQHLLGESCLHVEPWVGG